MVDSTMAVLTRGASRILVDSIAVDLQLKQVEFICCFFFFFLVGVVTRSSARA